MEDLELQEEENKVLYHRLMNKTKDELVKIILEQREELEDWEVRCADLQEQALFNKNW